MNKIFKPVLLSTSFIVLMCAANNPQSTLHLGFVPEAAAFFRAPIVRTAVVVGTTTAVVASSTANANAAAAANANAAAAAKAAQEPLYMGQPPVGTIVTTLPPGCATTVLNGVEYERCGSTYYKAGMAAGNLVFVVAQP